MASSDWRDGEDRGSDRPRRPDRRELLSSFAPEGETGDHWISVHRPAMACRFSVTLAAADARHVPAARAALDEVDAIEARLTVFRETSELVGVNRRADREPVRVSGELFSVLERCRELHGETGGAFDPTSTPLSRCWGFLARQGRVPSAEEIASARSRVGMEHVVLDAAERTVVFAVPGVELNLGSVGKGWALDRIAEKLRWRGLRRALLGAGGSSFRGWGREEWRLALRPGGELLGELVVRDAAVGVSGAGEQRFEAGGRRFGHVLDPRTGEPATGVRSAAAVADDAATADALATALLVGGPALAARCCESRPGTMALLVLDEAPATLHVFGARGGARIEPAAGIAAVVTPA